MTDIGKFTEPKNKMVSLLLWEMDTLLPWLSEFEVQKIDTLALIIEILYLKQNFFETNSCLLALTTFTSNIQVVLKSILVWKSYLMFKFYVWKQESFWWLSWNGVYLGKDISNWPGFQDSYCLNLQRTLAKRLTLSAVLIFVTEGWFIYLSFEESHRNRISRAGKKISPTISLFCCKMIA